MMSERMRLWIDLLGGLLFLLPICLIMIYFTWPWFVESWTINEASMNAGGLIRWPVKLMLPIGFALMALQGISEIIKRIQALVHARARAVRVREAAAMMSFVIHNMAPLMFAGLVIFLLIGYPAAFSLAAVRIVLRPDWHRAWPHQARFSRQPDLSALRHHLERSPARDPVLHVDGSDPRTMRTGRRPARFHRPVVQAGARRTVLCRHLRRRHSRCHHGDGCGIGHCHGCHRSAGDDAIWLFDPTHHRRHRRVRHHHPAHPAIAGADRASRPARALGRRHVQGRNRSEPDPACAVLRLGFHPQYHPAKGRPGAAARSPHAARLGFMGKMPARHHSLAWPDLPRARARSFSALRHRRKREPSAWSAPSRLPPSTGP